MVATLALVVSIAIQQVRDFYSLATTSAVMTVIMHQYKYLASSKASSARSASEFCMLKMK